MKIREFEEYLFSLKEKLNEDEGLLFGNGAEEVAAIQVSWMATKEAIREAGEKGANLMLVHEALFYPYPSFERPGDYLAWPVNAGRIELLSRYGISVIRYHGTLDEICVLDDFARALGFPEPTIEEELVKLYDIPSTTPKELVSRVKKRLSLEAVRVSCRDSQWEESVGRVGLPWGGLGLFVNVGYQNRLLSHDPDLFIAGESDSYAFYFAREAGVPMIETSHALSENPGLKDFAERLREEDELEGVPIFFYQNPKPWVTR